MGRTSASTRPSFARSIGEGQDIGRWDVLRAAAVEAGLDAEEMQRHVEAGTYRATVDAQIGEAQALGLTGVPTFIFDDRYAIVGAQPFSVFAGVMDRLGQAPRPRAARQHGAPADE